MLPELDLDNTQCMIRYVSSANSDSIEYANIPVMKGTKRAFDGELEETDRRDDVRWIVLTRKQLILYTNNRDYAEDIPKTEKKLAEFRDMSWVPRRELFRYELYEIRDISMRRMQLEECGAVCLPIVEFYRDDGPHSLLFSSKNNFFEGAADLLHMLNNYDTLKVPETYITGSDLAAIYWVCHDRPSAPPPVARPDMAVSPIQLASILSQQLFNQEEVISHFCYCHAFLENETGGLGAYTAMADIYRGLPGATISTLVLNKRLRDARWTTALKYGDYDGGLPTTFTQWLCQKRGHVPHLKPDLLPHAETFACIAMFESGTCNLYPSELGEVFAMSTGNSLYIARELLNDPYEKPDDNKVCRVVGNVGRPGITLLISPPVVKVRDANPEKWMAINHSPFDGKLEDHFGKTSIHLSFTDYEISVVHESNSRHIIDRPVNFVEALISVFDRGDWVAEVDVRHLLSYGTCLRVVCDKQNHAGNSISDISYQGMRKKFPVQMTSIENWDELIEATPNTTLVARAHRNWLARLALVGTSDTMKFFPFILPKDPCWACCSKLLAQSGHKNALLIC